jgi:hypothetical protein
LSQQELCRRRAREVVVIGRERVVVEHGAIAGLPAVSALTV